MEAYLLDLHAQYVGQDAPETGESDASSGSVEVKFRTGFGRACCGDAESVCGSRRFLRDAVMISLMMVRPGFRLQGG